MQACRQCQLPGALSREVFNLRMRYCSAGSALHAAELAIGPPATATWIVPGSVLQKLRVPVTVAIVGVAVAT